MIKDKSWQDIDYDCGDVVEATCLNSRLTKRVGTGSLDKHLADILVGNQVVKTIAAKQIDIARQEIVSHLHQVEV